MKITTKFNVNELVLHKYNGGRNKRIVGYEILEIVSQSCYAGTQIFYLCRAIIAEKILISPFDEDKGFVWTIAHATSNDPSAPMAWTRFREDELVTASLTDVEILTGLLTKNEGL